MENHVDLPPVLTIQGGQDRVSAIPMTNRVFQRFSQGDKNKIEYDDADHFLLQDGEWNDIVARDVMSWVEMHI